MSLDDEIRAAQREVTRAAPAGGDVSYYSGPEWERLCELFCRRDGHRWHVVTTRSRRLFRAASGGQLVPANPDRAGLWIENVTRFQPASEEEAAIARLAGPIAREWRPRAPEGSVLLTFGGSEPFVLAAGLSLSVEHREAVNVTTRGRAELDVLESTRKCASCGVPASEA